MCFSGTVWESWRKLTIGLKKLASLKKINCRFLWESIENSSLNTFTICTLTICKNFAQVNLYVLKEWTLWLKELVWYLNLLVVQQDLSAKKDLILWSGLDFAPSVIIVLLILRNLLKLLQEDILALRVLWRLRFVSQEHTLINIDRPNANNALMVLSVRWRKLVYQLFAQ
jgi:hypothetical protein